MNKISDTVLKLALDLGIETCHSCRFYIGFKCIKLDPDYKIENMTACDFYKKTRLIKFKD
jgi:hypothetical protein